MADAEPRDPPPPEAVLATSDPPTYVRLGTLILIRWIAVIGQVSALILVHYGLGYALPIALTLAAVGASAALNLFVALRHGVNARLHDRHAALYLGFDIVQLAVLLYLTGGLINPFQILLLAPVTVSAALLSRGSTVGLSLLAIGCVSLLALESRPLPWPGGTPPAMPLVLVFATWSAMVCTILFIAAYVSQVAGESRRMTDALAATQLALAREQRLAALGTLAAAAAHELGTPLATIAVIAKELVHDLPPDSTLAEDARLLLGQTVRCRDILADLARRPPSEGGEDFLRMPLSALVQEAADPHRREGIAFDLIRAPANGSREPSLARRPEIVHGLGNVLANALQYARREVTVELAWDARTASVLIADDGPGFPTQLLGRLGEPYLSTRRADGAHMGLGIFIAKTLLERTGATISFRNRGARGAEVVVRWPRGILEGGDERMLAYHDPETT